MSIPEQFQEQFKAFPATLRALVEAELDAGNAIVEFGVGHPASSAGAKVMLANPVSTRARQTGAGITFLQRQGSSHSGEFTDAARDFFVLEAPLPYVAPDMDAIRADMDARQRRADAEMDR